MKISEIRNISNTKAENKTKKHAEIPAKTAEKSAVELNGNYNIAFCGLLAKKQNLSQDMQSQQYFRPNLIFPDVSNNFRFKLQPNQQYFLPMNSILELSGKPFYLENYKNLFSKLQEGQYITVGRNPDTNIRFQDDCISRYHLYLEKYKDGVIVQDLNSRNGTEFLGLNFSNTPYDEDYSAIKTMRTLTPKVRTLLPDNSQLCMGNNYIVDIRNKNIQNMLNEKGYVRIGSNPNCDIAVPEFYENVSKQQIILEKYGEKTIATDLNYGNPTTVIPGNKISAFYNGAENINLKQGNIGDCYLLSTIYALSRNPGGKQLLENMVTIKPDGTYIVKFYNHEPIAVKLEELDGQKKQNGDRKYNVSGDLGTKAIERAYAKMIKNKFLKTSGKTLFLDIDDGGCPDKALKNMTGIKSNRFNLNENNIYNIARDINKSGINHHILTCATYNKGKYNGYVDPYRCFNERHAYAIKNIDCQRELVEIVNPHNTKVIYTISFQEFCRYFETLYDAYI